MLKYLNNSMHFHEKQKKSKGRKIIIRFEYKNQFVCRPNNNFNTIF